MKKWYQSKIIQAAIIQIVAAAALALNTALTSGLDIKAALIAMGSAAMGALIIVFRANTDTGISSAAKKSAGIGSACLALGLVVVFAGSGCGGALGQFTKDHQDEIAQLEQCALQCGTDIAIDTLSCPITGGNLGDLVNAEVAKGMAQTAGTCILTCLSSKALIRVCKKDK